MLAGLFLATGGCPEPQPEPKRSIGEVSAASAVPAPTEPAPMDEPALIQVVRTPWKGDLDAIAERRLLRVLVPFRRPEYFYVEGRPVGVLVEAFRELERALNERYQTTWANRIVVALLPTPMEKIRDLLGAALGDIAAGTISITERNRSEAEFSVPTVTGLKIVVVTGPGAPELKSVEDLSGKPVWVHPATRVVDDLEALNARLEVGGRAPALMRKADGALEPGDLLEMVNAGIYPITVVPSVVAEFWAQVFDGIQVRSDLVLAEDVELGWALQKDTPQLKAFVDEFLETHGVGTAFGNIVLRRYLKEARYVRNATEANELKKFAATVEIFKKYGRQYDLPYLLLMAQAYQESGLDHGARSPSGAVGIMQVLPSTAAGPPVEIPDISSLEDNVHAGAKLLRFLIDDYFDEPGLDLRNKTLFALAAYNAGPARIQKLRAEAEDMGYDPTRWFGNVEVAVARRVGRETTQYVANIYKYYLAYRLASDVMGRRERVTEEGRAAATRGAPRAYGKTGV